MIVHHGDWNGVTGEFANWPEMVKRGQVGEQRVRDVFGS